MTRVGPVLISGATGMLGTSLVPEFRRRGLDVVTTGRGRGVDVVADLTDRASAFRMLDQADAEVVVNLVGLTSVDLCEDDPRLAYQVNARTVENLADWMAKAGPTRHLVHISTDHVYGGEGLHAEANVSPRNAYAWSKLAGEMATARAPSTVLRTNFFGRSLTPARRSLTDWLFDSLVKQEEISVFKDVLFSPLSFSGLIKEILHVLQHRPLGVYNLGSHDGMSKAQFAVEFARCLDLPTDCMRVAALEEHTRLKAARPRDMRMNVDHFERAIPTALPSLPDEIALVARTYR